MFNKKFKFLSLALLVVFAVFVLAACGDDDTDGPATDTNVTTDTGGTDDTGDTGDLGPGWTGAMPDFGVGVPFRATETLDISMIFRELPQNPFSDDWEMMRLLQEMTNVNLDIESVMHDDFAERRDLLLATAQQPELMPFVWAGHEVPFIAGGQLLPIGQYFDYMPNFQHWVNEWDLGPVIENLRRADDNIYILPGLLQDPRVRFTVALRYDILEQLDIYTELEYGFPDSWEEIRLVLEEVYDRQAEFGLDYVYFDRWTLDSTLNISASTFGTGAGWGLGSTLHYNHDTGEFRQFAQMDESYEFVSYWAGLVADGLLHPESLTAGCDPAVEAFVNGRSFMVGAGGAIIEYNNDVADLIAAGHDHLEDIRFLQLPIPQGPAGVTGEQVIDNGIILSSTIRERDDFHAILQFVDWVWFSEEGREFSMWGVEGTHFEWVDGERQLLAPFYDTRYGLSMDREGDADARNMYYEGFGENVFVLAQGSSRDLMTSRMDEATRTLHEINASTRVRNRLNPSVPWASLGDQRREQYAMMQQQIVDHTRNQIASFIAGHRDMSEWDDFLAELEAMRLDDWVSAANEAYEIGPILPD